MFRIRIHEKLKGVVEMKDIIVKELKKLIPVNTWEFLKAHKAMLVGDLSYES